MVLTYTKRSPGLTRRVVQNAMVAGLPQSRELVVFLYITAI